MAKFCRHCGSQLRRIDAAFCSICGVSLGDTSLPDPSGKAGGLLGQKAVQHSPGVEAPHLLIEEPGRAPQTVPLLKPALILGRDPSGDITLSSSFISRHHARIEQRGQEYWIIDLQSTNGTAVNGRLITQHRLNEGDIIRIGDKQGNSVGLTFRQTTARPKASTIYLGKLDVANLPAFTIGRDPANQIHLDHPAVSRRHVEVRQTPQGHEIRDLNSSNGTFINGRHLRGKHTLRVGDVVHIGPFKLVYDQAGFTQYTPDGNYRLDALELRREVVIGSRLSIKTIFSSNSSPTRKLILKDVSLSIYPKEFIALVGGSGAGKSTLMKALSGFTPAEGHVLINGDNLYNNFAAYQSILGYVPQDDIIHGQLTVVSALQYAARLRMPDASPQEIGQRIQAVLEQVEMVEHAAKRVNQLSGGQRKRVSIAVELLAEPGLFFLDEPTSGLDPGLEKKMMHTMRQLADAGRTIVLVTHATANIDQCTHVGFLADGLLAYYGPPQEALTFFGAHDFADIYTRLSQPIDPAHNPLPPQWQTHYQQMQARHGGQKALSAAEVWTSCYQNSPQYQKYVRGRLQNGGVAARASKRPVKLTAGQRVSVLQQFIVLARRYLELIYRDSTSMFILLAVMPLIGFLLLIMSERHDLTGLPLDEQRQQIQEAITEQRENQDADDPAEQFQAVYQTAGSAQRLLFMLALAANLLGVFAAAYEIVKEKAIYRRERMVNLKIPPYLLSKLIILAGFAALQCFLLLWVVSWRVEYPSQGALLPWAALEMYVTLFLAMLASIGLGLLISALVRNTDTVIYIILLVLFIQIIFAGAIFDLPGGARAISYLTTTRWTLEALGSSVDLPGIEEEGVTCLEFATDPNPAAMSEEQEPCLQGQMYLPAAYNFNVTYDRRPGHLVSRWLALLFFTMLFAGLTYVVQKRKDLV